MTPQKANELLDTSIARFDDDAKRRSVGVPPRNTVGDDQLSLFDVAQDGSTLVSFEGETL